MSATGSYKLPESRDAAQAEIERLAAQACSGWNKESRTLSWFGLEDGMSVLELGSGPGFITRQLVSLVPTSSITCVEVDRTLIDQAEQYLGDNVCQHIRFVERSVVDTQLESEQFDFAYARFLFQHLPDPVSAAREIWRVLKPGGKLVIYDIDDALFGLFEPPIPEFAPVLEAFGQAQSSRGGDRYIGRKLTSILNGSGFCAVDLEVQGSHSADLGIDSYMQHLNPDRMSSLVDDGFLSEQELEKFRAAVTIWASLPDAYTLWLSLMICAEKSS